jgi:hypothetical protein
METVDFGSYFVVYNFIIGVLVMLASEKLGSYAGLLAGSGRMQAIRLVRLVTFTFGACVAVLMAGIFIAAHALKL